MITRLKLLMASALGLLLLVVGTVSCTSMTGGAVTGVIGDSYSQSVSSSDWVYGQNRRDPHAMDYD
jgi:hypothetical protein